MAVDKRCKYCNSEMKELKEEDVAGTIYYYMRCEKCRKEIARREE